MASPEKLLHEAQYAFQNIGQGATDARKHTARARRFARKLLAKYPDSVEAAMARTMLESLDDPSLPAISKLLEKPKTLAEVHQHGKRTRTPEAGDKDSWSAVWQRILRLPYAKKKALVLLLGLAVLFVMFLPFLALALFFYIGKPALIKKHSTTLLDLLHPESSG